MKLNEEFGRVVGDGEIEYAPFTIGDVFRPDEATYNANGWKRVNKETPAVPEGYRRASLKWVERDNTIVREAVDKPEVDETVWPEEPYRIISDGWEETDEAFVRHVVVKHVVDVVPEEEPAEGYHWEAVGEEETETEIIIKYEQVENPPAPPAPPIVLSKLYLEIALAKRGLLDRFDAWLDEAQIPLDESGATMPARRLYKTANDLSTDNPLYSSALSLVQEALGVDDATRDAIIEESVARS